MGFRITQWYQQMHVNTFESVYIHNGFVHVSAKNMAVFRYVKYKR